MDISVYLIYLIYLLYSRSPFLHFGLHPKAEVHNVDFCCDGQMGHITCCHPVPTQAKKSE